VREHQIELRLCPRRGPLQRLAELAIETEPGTPLREHVDCFGNLVHRLSLVAPHRELRVRAQVEATRTPTTRARTRGSAPGSRAAARRAAPRVPAARNERSRSSAQWRSCRRRTRQGVLGNVQALMAWSADSPTGGRTVHRSLFFEKRAGACWDRALARRRGARWDPARYASGYLDLTDDAAAPRPAATHAWAEVLVPVAGA
jgi:transglutaminase-like putative cysteine protease